MGCELQYYIPEYGIDKFEEIVYIEFWIRQEIDSDLFRSDFKHMNVST